jgi:hypothetical protein
MISLSAFSLAAPMVLLAQPLTSGTAVIQDATEVAAEASSAAELFAEIQAEFDQAMNAFYETYSNAESESERQKAVEDLYPDAGKFAPRFLALAKDFPSSETGLQSLIWVVQRAMGSPFADQAMSGLLAGYVEHEGIGDLCMSLQYPMPYAGDGP